MCLQCNSENELSSLPANTAKLRLSTASETDGGQFDNRDYRMDVIQSSNDKILTQGTKRTHPSETAEASRGTTVRGWSDINSRGFSNLTL